MKLQRYQPCVCELAQGMGMGVITPRKCNMRDAMSVLLSVALPCTLKPAACQNCSPVYIK